MIWDNFSIFRTNCAILTSYIRANPRTCRGLSRVCCHVAWSNGDNCKIPLGSFHSDGREEEPGLFYALLCSELMEKVSFSGSKISLILPFEWITSVALVVRVNFCVCLSNKTIHSVIELISEIPKQCLIITKTLFCRISFCFCLFWPVFKSFWKASPSSSFA